MDIRADLHCHSTHSDGSYSPQELLELAVQKGLQGLAITDHDSITSYKAIKPLLSQHDLKVISGVELSCVYKEINIHILGYAFDPNAASLEEFCASCRGFRRARNLQILERLSARGFVIEEKELEALGDTSTAIGRVHIAHLMMKKGYIKTVQEAFSRYIGEGKSCYAPGKKHSLQDAINAIHTAGGFAVIAHPHLIAKKKTVEELTEFPFDGLEAFYSLFPASVNQQWVHFAKEHNLFTTGGSDFHGAAKPNISLGASLTPPEVFFMLWERFSSWK